MTNPTDSLRSVNLSSQRARAVALVLIVMAGCWSFWTTMASLMSSWTRVSDYSHGFFVPLVAGLLLWLRRASCPAPSPSLAWPALGLIAVSMALRFAAAAFYLEACDGWALVLWVAGATWLVFGGRVALWAAPAIAFLLFMVPLPFRAEHLLSQPLQRMATLGSVWVLQTIGQPAFAEGNLILLGDHVLEVERACAGLRIFVGIMAAAFAWAVAAPRSLLERAALFASALPVAIVANILRIVVTALVFAYGSTEFANRFAHDAAGWLMMPLAIALLGLVYWYLTRLIIVGAEVRVADVVERQRTAPAKG